MLPGRSLTARAVIALALTVGFYALALSMVGFLVWLPYASVVYLRFSAVTGKLAIFCLIAAFIILKSVVPRSDRFTPPGPELAPDRHPRLFAEIHRTAESAGQPMPAEVYLVPDVNAWVSQRGGVMGIGGRRIMGIGLALLQMLKVSELRAVIAHEFGHYHGGDVKLGPLVYKTREALVRTVMALARHSGVLTKPFEWYAHLFFRVSQAVSRHQELQADALAARIAGASALARGLLAIHRGALAFGAYWAGEVSPVLDAGFLPPLVPGFVRFCEAPPVAADLARATEQELREGKADPYDTHPSLRDRLAALEQTDPEPGPPSDAPALALLDSVSELESMLLMTLMRGNGVVLKPLGWEQVGETVLMPRWTDFIKNYGHKLRGLRPSEIPILDWAVLGKELADSTGSVGHEERLAQFTVGAALALLLVRQGFTLDAPPGGPVALVRDGLRVEPFTLRARLIGDGAERWQQLCVQARIADVELGTVRDALRGL
jgi:heat shock protein HtpX